MFSKVVFFFWEQILESIWMKCCFKIHYSLLKYYMYNIKVFKISFIFSIITKKNNWKYLKLFYKIAYFQKRFMKKLLSKVVLKETPNLDSVSSINTLSNWFIFIIVMLVPFSLEFHVSNVMFVPFWCYSCMNF